MVRATALGVLVAFSVILALPRTVAAQTFDDSILSAYGEFEIDNGQTKTLAHTKHDRDYRICVHKGADNVPLKIMHDGMESMVYPGDCADVEGMVIQATPGKKLEQGVVIIGRYRPVD